MAKPDATAPPAIPDRGDGEAREPASDAVAETARPQQASPPKLPPPEGAVRLHPDWDAWLDPVNTDADGSLRDLLAPPPGGLMRAYPVSTAVSSVRNNGPELLTELEAPEEGTLF